MARWKVYACKGCGSMLKDKGNLYRCPNCGHPLPTPCYCDSAFHPNGH